MTFGFTVLGTAEDVQKQLPLSITYDSALGEAVKRLLAEFMPKENHVLGGNEYRYVVKASGHDGPTSFSLAVNVEPHWVPIRPNQGMTNGN